MSDVCSNGHPVASKARFCRQCGASVAPDDGATVPQPGVGLPGLSDPTVAALHVDDDPVDSQRRGRGPIVLVVAAGVILLLGLGAAIALLVSGSSADRQKSQTTRATRVVVSTTSSNPAVTTTVPVIVPPTSPTPVATRYCVRDTTPMNLHASPGIHADVIGLLMVGNCEAQDPSSGPQTEYSADGGNFRRIVWRGLDGWVVAGNLGSSPPAVPRYPAGDNPSCTEDAVLAGWTAAERRAYHDDPEYQAVAVYCNGTGAGAIAYGRFERGQLNPDDRMTEAVFRNTGTGWQELAHSGPTLLAADLASTGVSVSTLDELRSSAG